MNDFALKLVAKILIERLEYTDIGHCIRIDNFSHDISFDLYNIMCENCRERDIDLYILSSNKSYTDPKYITTDRAIELRNRKKSKLCLFIPVDMIDAAFSSLANSFEPIDGGWIQKKVIENIYNKLSNEAKSIIRNIERVFKSPLYLSVDRKLLFYSNIYQRDQKQELDLIGFDLWQVGLIADHGADWHNRLKRNRNATIRLSIPTKIQATTIERVDSLGIDKEMRKILIQFLQNKSVNDVFNWSKELSYSQNYFCTFDKWIFPQEDSSDLKSISIVPFVNKQGEVEKYCNLLQPDGADGILLAAYGPKESITVRWKCEPPKPSYLHRWRVELTPVEGYGLSEDSEFDLPIREISPSHKTLKLNLDLELDPDNLPDYPLYVRVTPLDKAGNPLRSQDEHAEELSAVSQEFYLSNEPSLAKAVKVTTSRRMTPTIAFGRIETLLDIKANETIQEREAQYNETLTHFSLRLTERRLIHLALSPLLVELERTIINNPQQQNRYFVKTDYVRQINFAELSPIDCGIPKQITDIYNRWLSSRKSFFEAIKRQDTRANSITISWVDLAETARRYADAYQQLLHELIDLQVDNSILQGILNIDTLMLQVQGHNGIEESIIVLPIHPIRAAWLANYNQLLSYWEMTLQQVPIKKRKQMIDLELTRSLNLTNVPPFWSHPNQTVPLINVGNLGFYYGVYAVTPFYDGERRLNDINQLIGLENQSINSTDDVLTRHLSRYINTFQNIHPYIDTLSVALVNTHNSPWITQSFQHLVLPITDDEESVTAIPAFDLTAYVRDPSSVASIHGINELRSAVQESHLRRDHDHLRPAIASRITAIDTIINDQGDETHLAILGDLTEIAWECQEAQLLVAGMHSVSVFGLVMRFLSLFTPQDGQLKWNEFIVIPDTIAGEHPAGPRYSKTLLDGYRAMLQVQGVILKQDPNAYPVLTYTLNSTQQQLIKRVHELSHWVITADRFFALDYYDSPNHPVLEEQSKTYLIEYAPEFVDGIDRRMFITTRWRDEIEVILANAMQELGFAQVDRSVGQLLNILKNISGQLSLHLTKSDISASSAVGLGVVVAYMKQRNWLDNAVLIPVDNASHLVRRTTGDVIQKGERRCDMLLVAMKRNIIEITFIEVKWRRGTTSFDSLAQDMDLQMRITADTIKSRYFASENDDNDDQRVDNILQRAYFANIIRFYAERAYRYELINNEVYINFMEHLRNIERGNYEFRPRFRGFIVTLEPQRINPIIMNDTEIQIISAADISLYEEQKKNDTFSSRLLIDDHLTSVDVVISPIDLDTKSIPEELKKMELDNQDLLDPLLTVDEKLLPVVIQTHSQSHNEPSEIRADPINQEINIVLGETVKNQVIWKPSVRGTPHLFIIGIPGQGKSVTTNHILLELSHQNIPALVLDFHGQFGDPQGSFIRQSSTHCVDAADGLPFSPFEVSMTNGKSDWKHNSAAIADIFAYVVGLGGMQKDLLLNAIQDAYKAHGYTADTKDLQTIPTIDEVLKYIEIREQKQKIRNVAARCRAILEMDLFSSEAQSTSLLEQIRKGLVIDLHNLMSEEHQIVVGAFVLRKLYRDMFNWGMANTIRLVVVLDEAHRLAKDITLPKLMKEGRKYGIAVVVASQGLNDFHQDVIGNAGTKIVFRTNFPESKKLAPYIQPRNVQEVAEQIEKLSVGTALVQTPEMSKGVIVYMKSSE
ncbi:ATP-binding protein [Herpetosiphon llansteffanensis]|uniref:ATP-binding protein n=1 Tax=Herpetosiphon llansteffanensis TaxID=2094568 RepID=UPI0013DF8622|nr:DUF87 domain-containing protein [Herpetosiphon llansteffanensis]